MDAAVDATRPLPGLVLAAGLGRRFRAAGGTGPKVLALVDGRPVLHHALAAARAADLSPVVVVIGPDLVGDPAFEALRAGDSGLEVVVNPRASLGMGSSLAVGLAHLADDPTVEACVVLLGDQPGVDPTVVEDAVAAWRRTGRPARTRYLDGPGHPVVLPTATWPMLAAASSIGARELLDTLRVEEVVVMTPAPRDVDVPDDLVSR